MSWRPGDDRESAMGHIVKANQTAEQAAHAQFGDAAAAASEVLLAARLAADAERTAAKGIALVLARKMAEKIIGHAVDLDPAVMADIANQAVQASRPRGSVLVLRVHPDDLPPVVESKPRWLAEDDASVAVRMVADPSVGRYGCVVETPVGRLDARLQTQLDVLERVLGGALERAE